MRISQFVISSAYPGVRTLKFSKNVMAFTEHGVAMLSSVLNTHRPVQVNMQIMRTFAKLREIISLNKDLARKLDELEKKYDAQCCFRTFIPPVIGLVRKEPKYSE